MKSCFIGELDARHLENKWWKLLAPFGFYSSEYDVTVVAPAGFVLDFSSVPRLPLTYWIAGGTGNKKSVPHDVGYRWFNERIMFDFIFHEAGVVSSKMESNQKWYAKTWRTLLNKTMTAAVLVVGWATKEILPGCLDYRNKTCDKLCDNCYNYYPLWKECKVKGYQPEILNLHKG
jgi:hypothetical protein